MRQRAPAFSSALSIKLVACFFGQLYVGVRRSLRLEDVGLPLVRPLALLGVHRAVELRPLGHAPLPLGVEGRDALGDLHRVIHLRRKADHPVADMNALGAARNISEEGLGGAHVRIPLEAVVLDRPDLVEALLLGAHHGLVASMSRRGNCHDNAVAESFFGTLKSEHLDGFRFRTREEAKLEVFNFIDGYYNPRRLHSTLGYQSPDEFERRHNPEPMKNAA